MESFSTSGLPRQDFILFYSFYFLFIYFSVASLILLWFFVQYFTQITWVALCWVAVGWLKLKKKKMWILHSDFFYLSFCINSLALAPKESMIQHLVVTIILLFFPCALEKWDKRFKDSLFCYPFYNAELFSNAVFRKFSK